MLNHLSSLFYKGIFFPPPPLNFWTGLESRILSLQDETANNEDLGEASVSQVAQYPQEQN